MKLLPGFTLELIKLSAEKVKCPKCGHMNHAGAEKCSNCGYHLGGSKEAAACPLATRDLRVNTVNRNKSIKADHIRYGPLNLSDEGYWEKLAKHWRTTPEVAKKSKCSNCVAFDISPRMQSCMPGMVQEDGYLGYCHMHHFKCHSARTCYTWASGGPITEDSASLDWDKDEKLAAAMTLGEAALVAANQPGLARRYNELMSDRLSKLLQTDIPGTEGVHLRFPKYVGPEGILSRFNPRNYKSTAMSREQIRNLSDQLSHPETAIQVAIPGSFLHMPITSKIKDRLRGLSDLASDAGK